LLSKYNFKLWLMLLIWLLSDYWTVVNPQETRTSFTGVPNQTYAWAYFNSLETDIVPCHQQFWPKCLFQPVYDVFQLQFQLMIIFFKSLQNSYVSLLVIIQVSNNKSALNIHLLRLLNYCHKHQYFLAIVLLVTGTEATSLKWFSLFTCI
jgi:hypothetical protein